MKNVYVSSRYPTKSGGTDSVNEIGAAEKTTPLCVETVWGTSSGLRNFREGEPEHAAEVL
jgi:hypothetical protein